MVPVKLSANENVLGSGPHARHGLSSRSCASIRTSADNALRAAIAEHFRLEPERLVFDCSSDEDFRHPQSSLSATPATTSSWASTASRPTPSAPACERGCASPKSPADHPWTTCWPWWTSARGWCSPTRPIPTGTILPDDEVRRLHASLPKDVLLVIDGISGEFCAAPEFSDGDLARTAENVVVTAPSPSCTVWPPCASAGPMRRRRSWPPSTASACRSTGRGHRGAEGRGLPEARWARSLPAAWPDPTRSKTLGLGGRPGNRTRQLRAGHLPDPSPGKTAAEAGLPRRSRPDRPWREEPTACRQLPAHHRGAGRAQPRRDRRPFRLPEGLRPWPARPSTTPSPSSAAA